VRRSVLAALPLLLFLPIALARPAAAHTVERFTACVALTATTPTCSRQGATFDAGSTVYLRGRVSPAHPGFGEVWRRAPSSERFVKVGIMGVDARGRIRWSGLTDEDDVATGAYTFQFRLPGHGRSWATRVRVRRPRPATVSLCAAISATDPHCYNAGVTYEVGQTVHLRGRVRPEGARTVEVLRRRPHESRLERVATVTATADGRARWTWTTRTRDIDGGAPYLFALRVAGGRPSNLVEVWVVPRHDP
jgi:5-hydroxyisourate hydrolase-like protein (transthyretin family)